MIRVINLIPLIVIILNSCSTNSLQDYGKTVDSIQWRQHQQNLLRLNQYHIHGILAYPSSGYQIYTNFLWKKISPNRHDLILNNLFGNIKLELDTQTETVKLIDYKGKYSTINNIEETIHRFIGIPIPLNNICRWIIGLPGETDNYYLNNNLLSKIIYIKNGCFLQVKYKNYDSKIKPPLPLHIELNNNNQLFKLKISSWTLK